MTQPRPTAAELVDAVRAFLDDDLLPDLQGRQRFHARVAVNVLGIVARELRDGPAATADERDRLAAWFAPGDEADSDELSRRLARAIRGGDLDIDDPDLLDHLRRTTASDLQIANPRYAPTD